MWPGHSRHVGGRCPPAPASCQSSSASRTGRSPGQSPSPSCTCHQRDHINRSFFSLRVVDLDSYPVLDPALEGGVADPYSFDTDSDPGLWWPKIEKIYVCEKKLYFWDKKNYTIYLPLGLHKGRPSYKRILQLSKENIQHFKHEIS